MMSWAGVNQPPAGEGTTPELAHEAHVDPDMWGQFGPGAVGVGWDLALIGLGVHLETGTAVDPAEGAAFATTPAGVEFVQRAATDWAAAAGADGDERGPAQGAAERPGALFTLPP